MKKPLATLFIIFLAVPIAVATILGVEVLVALRPFGEKETFKNPSREAIEFGTGGRPIKYVVMGDSTAAGQGAPYTDGIAMGTAEHLTNRHRIVLVNLAVSGATTADVVNDQLKKAVSLSPDLVLLSVGANDATHFTSNAKVQAGLETIVRTLRQNSPNVKILVTGCPQMGSIPRFPQPLRWYAGTQTDRINSVFATVVRDEHLNWSPIAKMTGPIFEQDPTLFSADEFHPNSRGYAVWLKVLNKSLDDYLL